MNPNRAIAALAAALVLSGTGALAQQKEEPSLPEQLIDGVRDFFRQIFAGDGEQAAAAPAPQDAAPGAGPAPAAQPKAATEPRAEVFKPTPAAQAEPESLHAIVARGDFATTSKRIAQGADIEAKDPGTGASVLHYAVMRGNPETIDLLLARGADVNSRTKNGTTPLHTAVLYNHYEVVEKLINRGAEINAQSASGATPLALASAARNKTIAELLRSHGAR